MNVQRIARGVTMSGLMLLPAMVWAQGAATSTIAGAVRDTSGAVLPGVAVEVASPVLIEKVRSTVTDGQGLYRIVDLRPGTYTVSFTLPGFGTIRREGVQLTLGFTATVNAELSVGTVEETVTVSGATPLVDTRSVTQQTSLQANTLDALPTTRRMGSYADFLPAAKGGADVGGLSGEGNASFGIHGGRGNEINVNQDGLNVTMLNSAVYSYNPAAVEEVVVETSGTSAESFSGGVRVNIVQKDGGNVFSGIFNSTYSNPDLQSDNLSDDLRARGLDATPSVKQSYQVAGGLGGPIFKDTLWFFTAHRKWVASTYVPGNFYNRLQGTLFYEADRSRPGFSTSYYRDHSLRLTYQVSEKDRVAVSFSGQDNCACNVSTDIAPEANGDHVYGPSMVAFATWTRPVTSRLLFEAGSSANFTTISSKPPAGNSPSDISVIDQALGLTYGSRAGNVATGIPNPCCYSVQSVNKQYNQRFSVSYITGAHAFKTGLTYQFYTFRNKNETAIDQIHGARQYTFNNRVPRSVRIFATPFGRASDSTSIGAFVQDEWTIKRLTLNLGLRYDSFSAVAVAQHFAAGYFVSERNFPEVQDVPVWRNLNPRVGASYDLFGNGRTALKVALGRYVTGTSSTGNNNVALNQPILNQANQADRTWNDATFGLGDPRTGNYVPDCVLGPEVPEANGECGPLSDQAFGKVRDANANSRYADDILHGFQDAQEYLWRGSVSLQHELRPGLGVNIGYYRTSYGNIQGVTSSGVQGGVRDNLLVAPEDHDPYCITAPSDPLLPGGGGGQICGLYDIKPEKFGQVFNLITQARNYGEQTDVFNGVDATVSARFGQGAQIRGGVAFGRQVTDNCFVVDSPQQLYQCHISPPWSAGTQAKFMVIYPLPWDLRASAVYQNVPGIPVQASYVATNAEIRQTLGRNLGACRGAAVCNATTTTNLIEPMTVFEDRRQQVDLRFARVFRVGRYSIEADVDLYNAFNANSVLAMNTRYGEQWRNAQEILPGRLLRFGAQFKF